MKREIVKDEFFLCQKCVDATKEDLGIAQDLVDTLKVHSAYCIGMAANMIGERKRIIVIRDKEEDIVMLNPEIVETKGFAEKRMERCLCHEGERPAKRYEKIKVKYIDCKMKLRFRTLTGLAAQAVQHEIDHCNGIII